MGWRANNSIEFFNLMIELNLEKIFYLSIGAVVGALTGGLLKFFLDAHVEKVKWKTYNKVILEELEDIKARLLLVCRSYERNIQIFALNGVSNEIPLKLYNPIFKKHYTDIALKLRASQRKSFSLIDAHIDGINSQIDYLSETRLSMPNKPSLKNIKEWGDLLTVGYCNVASTYWHVNYHLSNIEFPFLEEGSDEHTAYINQRSSSIEHVKNLIETTKLTLTPDSLK